MNWATRESGLNYIIGEKSVWRARFPAAVCTDHFTEIAVDEDLDSRIHEGLSPGVRAAYLSSCPLKSARPAISFSAGVIKYTPNQYKHYFTLIQGTFEAYLKGMDAKSRQTLTKKVRRFQQASGGEIHWREFKEPSEMEEFHALAREISATSYQERLLGSGFPQGAAFVESLKLQASLGAMRGYILFFEGKPIAYLYGPITRTGALLYQYVGYSPDHQKHSPGSVLQYLVLERLFGEGGIKMLDFTGGEGQHKRLFSTHNQWCGELFVFRSGARNIALVLTHSAFTGFFSMLSALAGSIGIKKFLKKFFRGQGNAG